MAKKRATIKDVQARVDAMSDKTIARCYYMYERHWGEYIHWIIFTDPDVRERLQFKSAQEVMDFLDSMAQRVSDLAKPDEAGGGGEGE
jgi:hypothetical protein